MTTFSTFVQNSESWFCEQFEDMIDKCGQEVCVYTQNAETTFRGNDNENNTLIHPDLVGKVKCLFTQGVTTSATYNSGQRGYDGAARQEIECLFKREDITVKTGMLFTTDSILGTVTENDRSNSGVGCVRYRIKFVTGLETLWHCAVSRAG